MENQNSDLNTPHAASKQLWRKELKERRENLSLTRRNEACRSACSHLYSLCNPNSLILSFASTGTEIDLWPLNEKLCAENRLALPLATEDKTLLVYLISNLNQLKKGKWGILEPDPATNSPIDKRLLSYTLVPGLGFDVKTRHRLGYGNGYYDRFLESLPSSIQTWGVGFLEQKINPLPYSNKDVSLSNIFLF